jgi:hypothetical protein
MTPPRNRTKQRKPESQIARKPALKPGFLQKRLLQTRCSAALLNGFGVLHGRPLSIDDTPNLKRVGVPVQRTV